MTKDPRVEPTLPVGFVPVPTAAYRQHRKAMRFVVEPGRPVPSPEPTVSSNAVLPRGARVLLWKHDAVVDQLAVRKAFLPGNVAPGPRDLRVHILGLPVVVPNAFGDLIESPGTPAFDAVHTFAVVRQILTMYQRALGGRVVPWQWNGGNNTEPLSVFPHAGETQNALYSRDERALKFFFFDSGTPRRRVFTCRSFDIVAHETGHALLDGLQPHWIESVSPQTAGLHESFGDLTAIFFALSQSDHVEAVIVQTKANLHDKMFLADLAEDSGLSLGRSNGLRNADNDLKLSDAGSEVRTISQVFTGAIYDILADIFSFERRAARDDAAVLLESAEYLRGLVLRSLIAAPTGNASFADVANRLLSIAHSDGKPVAYRNFIRNRFVVREVLLSSLPARDHDPKQTLAAMSHPSDNVASERSTCCGTMNLPEFTGGARAEMAELEQLQVAFERLPSAAGYSGTSGRPAELSRVVLASEPEGMLHSLQLDGSELIRIFLGPNVKSTYWPLQSPSLAKFLTAVLGSVDGPLSAMEMEFFCSIKDGPTVEGTFDGIPTQAEFERDLAVEATQLSYVQVRLARHAFSSDLDAENDCFAGMFLNGDEHGLDTMMRFYELTFLGLPSALLKSVRSNLKDALTAGALQWPRQHAS